MAQPPATVGHVAAPIDARRLLADCDESQRRAITVDAAPLLIVAGAGSGKTRVLTRRIAWSVHQGAVAAPHVLALTFTRKAAAELRERLTALGLPSPVTAGTFHAVALGQLRRRASDLGQRAPALLDSKARLITAAMTASGIGPHSLSERLDRRSIIAAFANEIEWAKARLVSPSDYEHSILRAHRTPVVPVQAVLRVWRSYEDLKRQKRILDFDDLLSELTALMNEDVNFAAAQRFQFTHFFVDELQDANPLQLCLLDAWLGGRKDLVAVGDPRQSIYGWNGADATAISTFSERYPGATVVHLEANYRSTPQVVAISSAALHHDELPATESLRPEGTIPTVRSYASDRDEAEGVAKIVRRSRGSERPWSHFAILARTNAQLRLFEAAFDDALIPHRFIGGAGFLASPAVHAALETLNHRSDARGFAAWSADLEARNDTATAGSHDEGEDAFDEIGGISGSTREEQDLVALGLLAREYEELDPFATKAGFCAYLNDAFRTEAAPGHSDGVELVTFHRAKGLEWPVVFVTGLEDGLVPIAHAKTGAALEEERRLLYVALSRAQDELHCSWAKARTFGARSSPRVPSPYLAPIETMRNVLEQRSIPDADLARRSLAESRAVLARKANRQ
jgi:DNA helicase-2/ATP-dependent DNA helicase PcrA